MARTHGLQVGIESKVEYQSALDSIGIAYESWRRSALNWLQSGLSEEQVEKRLQADFELQWAWADSIATEAKQTFDQLESAKEKQISLLTERIKAKTKKAKQSIKKLERRLKKPFNRSELEPFNRQLMGLKAKIAKIASLQHDLRRLRASDRLHICFGSAKLFNAQHRLEENGYESREQWLEDWRKKRSGRFFCIGKSQVGGGTMTKVLPLNDDGLYQLQVQVPRPLQAQCGKFLLLEFEVADRALRERRSYLNYALETQKPITVQVFRREHKDDQWYVHLTTYVEAIPLVHTRTNGCLGIDFNKDSISVTYVKRDGNMGSCIEIPFEWKGLTSGQRRARMRDIVVDITKIAEIYGCSIAIESLDFTKKKARMSEESKLYNEMLSNLSTSLFRTSLESRCRRQGIELIKVNPAFTSIIGMLQYMARYGLNSGSSAALVIARRAMRLSENVPNCLLRPEDQGKHPWSVFNRVARFIKAHHIKRSQLFQWTKSLGVLLTTIEVAEHLSSFPVSIEMGEPNRQITEWQTSRYV